MDALKNPPSLRQISHTITHKRFTIQRMSTITKHSDTTDEALEIQLECFRRMAPQGRIAKMSS